MESEPPHDPAVSRARAPVVMATLSRADRLRARILAAQRLLATGRSERRARAELAKAEGLGYRQAARYVRAAQQLWAIEMQSAADDEARAQHRAEAEATLQEAIARGFDRESMALDKDGCEHFYDDPDLRTVVTATETLAKLRGLIGPSVNDNRSVHVHLGGENPRAHLIGMLTELYLGSRDRALPRVIDAIGEEKKPNGSSNGHNG